MKVKEFDILYNRDSKGRIRSWEIKVIPINDDANTEATIVQQSGLLLGKKVSKVTKINKGKNIGRGNETTPFNQAVNDAESKHNKKVLEGYKDLDAIGSIKKVYGLKIYCKTLTIEKLNETLSALMPTNNTDKDGFIRPMKAQPYWNELKNGTVPRITFPCLGQAKINGFRCVVYFDKTLNKITFKSKNGLIYNTLEHIENELKPIFELWEEVKKQFVEPMDLILDGEIYIPGEILSNISSAVRKRGFMTPMLEYHVFDLSISKVKQITRIRVLEELISNDTTFVKCVRSVIIHNSKEAEDFTDKCIKEGNEGGIFRDTQASYQFGKRPKTMVKLKRKESKEFTIIDVIDTDKAPQLALFICRNDLNDKTFKVVPEGTHEKRKEYFNNRENIIGKPLTVEYYERTKDDLPFHSVGIVIRDYE